MYISRRAFLACAAALVTAGCSQHQPSGSGQQAAAVSETVVSNDPKPLEIVESGWSTDENGWTNFGIAIKNPNQNFEADYIKYTVTAKDEDGSILFSSNGTISAILPNETIYDGGLAGGQKKPATVEFNIADGAQWYDFQPLDGDVFTISNTSEVNNGEHEIKFTGEVTQNFDLSQTKAFSIHVVVITRDADGRINYGNNTSVDFPGEGKSAPFDITSCDVPEHASYEIHACMQ